MCLIALALGASERFPFVVAANRDEFLDRPTAPLASWSSPGGVTVVSGRDLRDGGIWMGFAPNGRFAMLTNVRQPDARLPAQPISRGGLALSWLESSLEASEWAAQLDAKRYQGFNLIVGHSLRKQCIYLSNQQNLERFRQLPVIKRAQSATELIAYDMPWNKVYGLSNAALDTPWPKTQKLKNALGNALHAADASTLASQAITALADRQHAADADLPATGVSLELEQALSSVFVQHPQDSPLYGTRTSTVAVLDTEGRLDITELTHAYGLRSDQSRHEALIWRSVQHFKAGQSERDKP